MKFSILAGVALAVTMTSVAAFADAPPVFAPCKACHKVVAGGKGVGPTLFGVVGRAGASAEGYAYSEAYKKVAPRKIDAAFLDKWLADPKAVAPGTKMVFPGIKDDAARKAVIDYLGTLK